MCFGSRDNADDRAPKPAQVPPPRPSAANPKANASMPQDYAPPPGPPPSHNQDRGQNHPYPPQSQSAPYYAPPPGPPPSHSYAAPPGPPPSDTKNNPFFNSPVAGGSTDYAPPPGPPPSHIQGRGEAASYIAQSQSHSQSQAPPYYAPPPGPPPSQEKPPKHDWQSAVPDTALLPPPPNFFGGFDRSPANNATEDECAAGESWCAAHPLFGPMAPSQDALSAAARGAVAVYAPPPAAFAPGVSLSQPRPGVWRGASGPGTPDTCLATYPPLYQAAAHSPLATGRARKTVYYEVRVLGAGDEVPLALGYVAPPYPAFRLPGWHRGSLGVHGDDGHRYVNDRWGGRAFAAPFRRGETLGLGMEFHAPGQLRSQRQQQQQHGGYQSGSGIGVQVFLTRDGVERGRWDLHEETDRETDLPVTGLEGYHDLCAAVGVFDRVEFEIVFAPELWRWRGYRE